MKYKGSEREYTSVPPLSQKSCGIRRVDSTPRSQTVPSVMILLMLYCMHGGIRVIPRASRRGDRPYMYNPPPPPFPSPAHCNARTPRLPTYQHRPNTHTRLVSPSVERGIIRHALTPATRLTVSDHPIAASFFHLDGVICARDHCNVVRCQLHVPASVHD